MIGSISEMSSTRPRKDWKGQLKGKKVSEEAAATFWRVMGNVVLATISKRICQIPPVETSPTFFPASISGGRRCIMCLV